MSYDRYFCPLIFTLKAEVGQLIDGLSSNTFIALKIAVQKVLIYSYGGKDEAGFGLARRRPVASLSL